MTRRYLQALEVFTKKEKAATLSGFSCEELFDYSKVCDGYSHLLLKWEKREPLGEKYQQQAVDLLMKLNDNADWTFPLTSRFWTPALFQWGKDLYACLLETRFGTNTRTSPCPTGTARARTCTRVCWRRGLEQRTTYGLRTHFTHDTAGNKRVVAVPLHDLRVDQPAIVHRKAHRHAVPAPRVRAREAEIRHLLRCLNRPVRAHVHVQVAIRVRRAVRAGDHGNGLVEGAIGGELGAAGNQRQEHVSVGEVVAHDAPVRVWDDVKELNVRLLHRVRRRLIRAERDALIRVSDALDNVAVF